MSKVSFDRLWYLAPISEFQKCGPLWPIPSHCGTSVPDGATLVSILCQFGTTRVPIGSWKFECGKFLFWFGLPRFGSVCFGLTITEKVQIFLNFGYMQWLLRMPKRQRSRTSASQAALQDLAVSSGASAWLNLSRVTRDGIVLRGDKATVYPAGELWCDVAFLSTGKEKEKRQRTGRTP